jgi:1,4-dihydroxy-6-naphthoate synthase
MGDRYGPTLVTREPATLDDLVNKTIAIPGRLTSAYLTLQLCLGKDVPVTVMPFDEILPAVAGGTVAAGLLIHEGQLYYGDRGLHKVLDLGQWWFEQTGLPLPLGGNVVRKDLGEATVLKIAGLLKQSIRYALDHRDEALAYALQYARDLDPALADRFVGMYVNDWTVDYGPRGREAVRLLLSRAAEAGLVPGPVDLQFVG